MSVDLPEARARLSLVSALWDAGLADGGGELTSPDYRVSWATFGLPPHRGDLRLELREVHAAPDGRVVAIGVTQVHLHDGGGHAQLVAVIYRFDGGRIAGAEIHPDRRSALRAAGVRS